MGGMSREKSYSYSMEQKPFPITYPLMPDNEKLPHHAEVFCLENNLNKPFEEKV